MSSLEESVEFLGGQPRCPCALILDTSGSMSGAPIAELNKGLQTLQNELSSDTIASQRVEVAVVEFNSNVRVLHDFTRVEDFQPPTLSATGSTDMVGGIQQGLDLIKKRKEVYHANGVPYYRPWAFLITDGQASNYQRVAERIKEEEARKGVVFFAVGVGQANMQCLTDISVRPPLMLAGLNFNGLFEWLSVSMKKVSQSSVGAQVALDPPGWSVV